VRFRKQYHSFARALDVSQKSRKVGIVAARGRQDGPTGEVDRRRAGTGCRRDSAGASREKAADEFGRNAPEPDRDGGGGVVHWDFSALTNKQLAALQALIEKVEPREPGTGLDRSPGPDG
jgi:hypothetical protein